MPPMATSASKRKWSDVFGDREIYDKQSIMDLCTSKLRYVNPARPPRRRTEVPLLRNVLIVNTMKHLSAEMKIDKPMEYSSEDLCVDPGHFEGLPPLSELLTDIMLDPQPNDQQQQAVGSFGWTGTVGSTYSSLTPLEPSISSYMDAADSSTELGEEKIVHDLLPCTSVVGIDQIQHSWRSPNDSLQHSSTWQVPNSSCHHHPHSPVWNVSNDSSVLDCFLSSASLQPSSSDSVDALTSELAFQSSSSPLPAFSSLFESPQNPSFTELLQTSALSGPSSAFISTGTCFSGASSLNSLPTVSSASADDIVGNVNLTETELEFLAMTFSAKLPLSFEDLVHALPQTSLLQQTSQPSQTFCVPSSLQGSVSSSCDSASNAINQCASYCRSDQPPANADDSGMVRVLVNL
ncbi:unnamed protein product [Candidula unifasciata]|uniref:SERTA domain-containing protein n=1 Tax=Candidula unifasciata TaxID=100452 RepID=A0A8S3Z6H2_9EUPU|nr:unnamed protein product [Candidula unifasciata]